MKHLIAFGAVAALAATTAFADEKGGHKCMETDKGMEAKAEAHFKEVDADADGKVTETELLAFVTSKARQELAAMAGNDGVATLDEMKAHRKAKHKEMMEGHAKPESGETEHKPGEH